jgi:hypothetical protein
MPKYNEKQIDQAINNCPIWMSKNVIAPNGKVLGEYKFESKQINLLTYNDSLRRKLFDFEAYYLRDEVWTLEMKMGLMWSICHEITLPSFWLAEHPDDASKCDIIDSKNRSVAIFEFFNNDFPIPIEVDGKIYKLFWKDIERCTPPEPKSQKKLTELQERLKSLNQVIRNTTILVNKVYGCGIKQRAQLSALLSRAVSWTPEELLFNFNWHCRSLFKFIFNYCIQSEGLHLNINKIDVATNHRDKGSIFVGKVLFLLYGEQFKDSYSDRHLGNNIKTAKEEKKKTKLVQYIQNIDDRMTDNESLINNSQDCRAFFAYIGADFQLIESLKKTCKCLGSIFKVQQLTKKLDVNDMLDIIVHIQRKVNERILTHAMLKKDKSKFHDLIDNFRKKKNERGDEATAQSSIPSKVQLRREIFEECLRESGLDLGIKNKKLSKKQIENAYWASNGFDPATGELILKPEVNHGNATSLSSNPGKVEVLDSETNRYLNNMNLEFTKKLSDYQTKLKY